MLEVIVRRLMATSGDFTIWRDSTIEVDGIPDRAFPFAQEIPVQDLPPECLIYLMGSRYCQTDLMSQADACNGSDPHEAQALRQAACAYLSVVAQR